MSKFSNLLSPLKIGGLEVRNRVLVSAHVPGFAEHNKPGDKYIAYHRTYAHHGVGLQITGGTPVHQSGLLSTASDGLWNLDDSIVPGYAALSEAVHAEGGRILAQLAHSAGTVLINQPGRESWSASAVRSETTGNIPHAMSTAEIEEVISAHAAAAHRVAAGNMDGVEILGAFGFLPQAFLSPLTNRRSDRYGGSADNRLRFVLELLEAVRPALGEGRVLGLRIPGDEFEPGGLTIDDMKVFAQRIEKTGLIDYLNIIAHTNVTHMGRARHWAPTPTEHGKFVHLAAAVREVVKIPVFAVGRVVDPHQAEAIVAAGQADMVGMTRAHICDPELVAKVKRGATREIRPCVGANTCIANRYIGKPIRCMHNAAVPNPGSSLTKTSSGRRVVVIGGGPAGLECARVAAERGHSVTLYEAGSIVGGQLGLWAAAPSMGELGNIIRWRTAELGRLGVTVETNRRVDSSSLDALDADVVVMAAGATDYCRDLPGDQRLEVVSPHSLLRGHRSAARKVLVLNEGRGQAGLAAAEVLLQQGKQVEIVTSDIAVAADLDPTNRNAWYERLGRQGCDFTGGCVVVSASGGTVVLRNVFDDRLDERGGIDLVVDWPGCRANDELFGELEPNAFELHRVGDCVAPRTVEAAIAEAMTVAERI